MAVVMTPTRPTAAAKNATKPFSRRSGAGDGDPFVEGRRVKLRSVWRAVPGPVCKTVVAVVGTTLILLGVALVVLPGPFTIPLLAAGFFVLGTEFAWAAAALAKTRKGLAWAADTTRRSVRAATTRQVPVAAVWDSHLVVAGTATPGVLELTATEVRFRPVGDHADNLHEAACIIDAAELVAARISAAAHSGDTASLVLRTSTGEAHFVTSDPVALAAELSRRYRIPRS